MTVPPTGSTSGKEDAAVFKQRISNPFSPRQSHIILIEWILVVLLFFGLSLSYLYPLWLHPTSYIVGPGDPLQHLSVQWWTSNKLLSGHWGGMWNLPPMYFPARATLTYGDPQFGTTLLGLPIFQLTHSIVAAYNFPILISFPLSGIGVYALLKRLSRSRSVGLLAGIVWAFCPWHAGEAAHQQILSVEFLPWILLALHGYADTRRARWLILLAASWTMQAFMAEYWGAFLILLIPPFALMLMRVQHRCSWRELRPLVIAMFLGALPWLILQYPMLHSGHKSGHSRTEIKEHSADLSDYLPAWMNSKLPHIYRGPREANLTPGLVVLAGTIFSLFLVFSFHIRPFNTAEMTSKWLTVRQLAILGLIIFPLFYLRMTFYGTPDWLPIRLQLAIGDPGIMINFFLLSLALFFNQKLRRYTNAVQIRLKNPQAAEIPYMLLLATAALFSFGYEINFNGYYLLAGPYTYFEWIPGFKSLRVLHRVGIFADLGMVALAGMSLAEILRRYRQSPSYSVWLQRAAIVGLGVIIWLDISATEESPFTHSGLFLPPNRKVDSWLRLQPRGPLLELPLTVDAFTEGERLWHQMAHQMPMVNGAETYFRTNYYGDVRLFARPTSLEALNRLRVLGIRYVILDLNNRHVGDKTYLGLVPSMPSNLPPPFTLIYQDDEVKVYRP